MTERTAIVSFFVLMLAGCTSASHPGPSMKKKGIVIQPISFDDTSRVHFVQQAVSEFYHCPVYILPPRQMPITFVNRTKGERYSADSILRWLSHQKDDSISIVS